MKELSIEEKAKAYDEAIEKAKDYYHLGDDKYKMAIDAKAVMEYIFPELKESVDERIRKALIRYFTLSDEHAYNEACGVSYRDIVAWLEKQGEQPKKHDVCDNCDQQGSCVSPCPMKLVEKQGEQKPVDTAKQEMSDEEYCSLCMDINCDGCPYVDKSKHKEQKPVEWSEEDETVRNDIIAKLAILKSRAVDGGAEKEICEMEINWLKSLRPQSTWKPSEEQMEALDSAIHCYAGISPTNNRDVYALEIMKEQLKKLREK